MLILVTGFEPFGGEKINPSEQVISLLPDVIGDHQLIKAILPVTAQGSLAKMNELLVTHKPDVAISVGQAGGISSIKLEKVGINLDDFRIADNAGDELHDVSVFKDGPDAYLVHLPLKRMKQASVGVKVPAEISYSAGTFICNHVLYGTSYLMCKHGLEVRNGFIHVPYSPEQVLNKPQMPSMSVEAMVRGLEAMLSVIDQQELSDLKEGSLY